MKKHLILAGSLLIFLLLAITSRSLSQSFGHTQYFPLAVHHEIATLTPTVTMTPRPTFTPTPTPVPEFQYSTSHYLDTTSTSVLYNLGCQKGLSDLNAPGIQDSIIILDFGQPWGNDGEYGTRVFDYDNNFRSNAQIGLAVQQFGKGYFICSGSDNLSKLTIGIGTSNYGTTWFRTGTNSADHGREWALMVAEVSEWMVAQGYSSQVSVAGAIDIELSWNTYEITWPWVHAFDQNDQSKYVYYDFGACEGCPTRLNPTPYMPEGWSLFNVWKIAWGNGAVWPLPLIYAESGVNARQWAWLSKYSHETFRAAMYFPGLMTQHQACQQVGGCAGIDNTPQEGHNQLLYEVNYFPETAQQSIRWTTDIKWNLVR